MSFGAFTDQQPVVELLQRSLDRGRLAHAYLFAGDEPDTLEAMASALARTLMCANPSRLRPDGPPVSACDRCLPCRKVAEATHPDVHWLHPESKSRQITIDQMRELLATIHLKPNEASFKVAVITAADRFTLQAANAFLKTLEEPPVKSVLILLTTEPGRVLETIVSRCLRIAFAGGHSEQADKAEAAWRAGFVNAVAAGGSSILERYNLLARLLAELARLKEHVENEFKARSPLKKYEELDPKLRERWEDELAAAIEADYRHRRSGLLTSIQEWLHDVWVLSCGLPSRLIRVPKLQETSARLARQVSPLHARENLQLIDSAIRLLNTNVQEALVLEVTLLKLRL